MAGIGQKAVDGLVDNFSPSTAGRAGELSRAGGRAGIRTFREGVKRAVGGG